MNAVTTNLATPESMLERLRALALEAAEYVRPYAARMDVAGYRCFLNAMYHYTRNSGDKAQLAARNCPPGELRDFFEHMQREEQGHYKLAEADLKACGYAMHAQKPPAVEAFDTYWASIQPEEYVAYLGAIAVFENVARHVGADVFALVQRLQLSKTQVRWLLVHVQADEHHGRDALALGELYLSRDPARLLAGATEACALWKEIFRSACEDQVELQPVQA